MATWEKAWIGTALLILGSIASYAAGATLGKESWLAPAPAAVPFAIACTLHLSWIGPCLSRRAPLAAALAWSFSCLLALRGWEILLGVTAPGRAIGLELLLLVIARAGTPSQPLPEIVARWRRLRAAVLAQAEMGSGCVPWARTCIRQLLFGSPEHSGLDHARMVAELKEAEAVAELTRRAS